MPCAGRTSTTSRRIQSDDYDEDSQAGRDRTRDRELGLVGPKWFGLRPGDFSQPRLFAHRQSDPLNRRSTLKAPISVTPISVKAFFFNHILADRSFQPQEIVMNLVSSELIPPASG